MKIAEFIHKLGDFLQESIYPRLCFVCKSNEAYLCQNCLEKIELAEAFYIPRLNRVILGGDYDNPGLKKAVHLLKYRGVKEIAEDLVYLLRKRLSEGIFIDSGFKTVLVPIPISQKRWKTRGFNQAETLARALSRLSGMETKNLLEKIKDTPAQVEIKSRKERLKNVRNSFSVNKDVFDSLEAAQNLRIVIVDDVITTGATMSEAGRVLRKAGIKNIVGLAIAKG